MQQRAVPGAAPARGVDGLTATDGTTYQAMHQGSTETANYGESETGPMFVNSRHRLLPHFSVWFG